VEPKQAAGTAGPTDYSFTDLHPFAGVNFYRLVQYDIDGNKKYLGIVVVTFSASDRVHIFPNPADGDLLLLVLDKDPVKGETFTLVTASGSMVQTGPVGSRSQGIDISRLPKGLYVLKLSNGRSFKIERR
jgi:hypothetical protein